MSATQNQTTKEDILQYLLKHGQARAQVLAETLGVSPQAIRRHLKELEAENLILHQAVPAKMGRPQHVYALSREGRARLPDNYNQFAVSLLTTLAETVPPDQFRDILKSQWQKKVEEYRDRIGEGSLGDRLTKLTELRQAEGFMAEVHPLDSEALQLITANGHADPNGTLGQGPGFVVTEYNCAIAEVAESFPTVCGHELELFTALFPDCQVKRTHWMIRGQHSCGYLIQQYD